MDEQLFFLVNQAAHPVLDIVAWLLSEVGRGDMAVFIMWATLILVLRRVDIIAIVVVLAASLLAGVATVQMKDAVQRPRPLTVFGDRVHVVGQELRQRSFPSGHTASAVAITVAGCRRMRRRGAWVGWGVFAAGVGWSRVYVGAHFPLDVFGGALLGMLCGEACDALGELVRAWWARRRGAA